jgi:hypothetical protein
MPNSMQLEEKCLLHFQNIGTIHKRNDGFTEQRNQKSITNVETIMMGKVK